jgi:hypothetical protein
MEKRQNGDGDSTSGKRVSTGTLFKSYRKEAGITQESLAEVAGVSDRTIRLLEDDGYCSADTRRCILTALNRLREADGYPSLRLVNHEGHSTLEVAAPGWLELPIKPWLREFHGPGALLTADYRVVKFHGARSQAELGKLEAWCREPRRLGIRIYKGQGGMGKTRLALELCHSLRAPKTGEIWTTGFARLASFPTEASPWEALPDLSKPLLVVVDYAGELRKTKLVTQLLRHLDACHAPKVRLLFLERDDLWLDRLHEDRAAREVLLGPLLSKAGEAFAHPVEPVAVTTVERTEAFRESAKAFCAKLELKAPHEPAVDLSGHVYDRVLYLQMQALLAVLGKTAQRRDAILQHLLARERDYWRQRIVALGLSVELLPAVERALAEISSRDGVPTIDRALQLFSATPLLQDLTELTRRQVATLLRECYPDGETGIGPLRPDELKHFLMARFI